jgi:stage II sporulation protein D
MQGGVTSAPAGVPSAAIDLAETVAQPSIRVGIQAGVARASIGADSGVVVRGRGPGESAVRVRALPRATFRTTPAGRLRLLETGDELELASVAPTVPSELLQADATPYRGLLEVRPAEAGTLTVVNVVYLEDYLRGVIPNELSPQAFPQIEALKAQAVAARSYALASLVKGKQWDLYADVRSQVYYGVERESPTTTTAVNATRGEVLTYAGKVVTAFYYSSSGGRTAASADVFGVPVAYLQSVDDPWDDVSPFHRWQPRTFTAAALAKAFGLTSAVADVTAVETASGRPATVLLGLRNGTTVQLRAADVRARLGLRSTAFRLGVLRFARPGPPTTPGTPVQLSGIARDVEDAVLEKLGANGAWARSARLTPGPDGTFTVTVRPRRTSTYRLSAAGLPGPALTLTVVPGTTG